MHVLGIYPLMIFGWSECLKNDTSEIGTHGRGIRRSQFRSLIEGYCTWVALQEVGGKSRR